MNKFLRNVGFYLLIILVAISVIDYFSTKNTNRQEVEYTQFLQQVDKGDVSKVVIIQNTIHGTLADGTEFTTITPDAPNNDPDLYQKLSAKGIDIAAENPPEPPWWSQMFSSVIPILLLIGVWFFIMQQTQGGGGRVMSFGKSRARMSGADKIKVTFRDVAGADEAKQELEEVVEFLKHPKKFNELGARIPKGVLLFGPPGTGKTLLARAVAGEAGVPFFSISGSDFVEMFVGVGASRVRDLFEQAKKNAPCIVFIDEIDAIGQKRTGAAMGNDEREQTLNQLLTEMDGFEGNTGVIILAATNRPDSLDPALLRPGRFDRRVPVELPDLKGREDILKVHAKKVRMADDVNFHTIARMAAGASGAELANIINEGALRAVRSGRSEVTEADLEESIEVVIAGYQKKNAILSDAEKRTVAYHEIGHALVAALQSHSAPVQKITIIPRTSGALGYTMQVEQQDKYILSREELENKIATFTAGRAAEEVKFGLVSTGASNDIEQATKLARAMITRYGMSEEFDMVAMETVNNRYLGGDTSLTCSAATQQQIDKKVVELVRKQHEKAIGLLKAHMDKLDALASYLYEKETITGEEFMKILEGDKAEEPQVEAAEQKLLADEAKDDRADAEKAKKLAFLPEEERGSETKPNPDEVKNDNA